MFVRVWEYEVVPGREAEFERMYAHDGPWARLFGKSDGFLGTELFRSLSAPRGYLTVDRFADQGAWIRALERSAAAYAALDEQGEGLTLSEREIAAATSN